VGVGVGVGVWMWVLWISVNRFCIGLKKQNSFSLC
jgi:hypothetical protein